MEFIGIKPWIFHPSSFPQVLTIFIHYLYGAEEDGYVHQIVTVFYYT